MCTPAQTLARVRPLMPQLGITRLANITGLADIRVPVVAAIRPNGAASTTALGKGLDLDAARVSALMEALETWHAENVDLPLRLRSHAQLREAEACVDPGLLPRSGPAPDEHAAQLWIRGEDLLAEQPTWVPWPAVSLMPGLRRGRGGLVQDTNGLASGNHLLEAICHGLCEVIERDCLVLWRGRRGLHHAPDARRVDLDSVDDPACRQVLAAMADAGLAVGVWDLQTELGVPAYACLALEPPDRGRLRVMTADMGSGAHLSPRIALLRALTEAVQARVTFVAGARDNLTREHYARSRNPKLHAATWEALRDGRALRRFDAADERASGCFEADLHALLDALRGADLRQAVVVDLSKAELGVPVVKVIVPGLESMHATPGPRARSFWAAQTQGAGGDA
nr:YcaO-like family protein [Pseudenhygromyxa sp. WMMC2535]